MRCRLMALALLCSSASHAFTVLPSAGNNDVRWRDLPLKFKVNYAHSPYDRATLDALLRDALGLWNSVSSSNLRIELDGETDAQGLQLLTGQRVETAVVFDPQFGKTLGSSNTASVLAVGTSAFEGDRYVRGVILVNAQIAPPSQDRLKLIIAHEAGHVFGLGHTSDEAALMYPVARSNSVLGDDDVSGITYLYPRKEPFDGAPFGCATTGAPTGGSGGNPPWLAAFWLTVLAGICALLRDERA